jgi:ABC-type phosphate transport system ATPase subunit
LEAVPRSVDLPCSEKTLAVAGFAAVEFAVPAQARDRIKIVGSSTDREAIVIITRSMRQATRVSQRTAFFHPGEIVEAVRKPQVFANPHDERNQGYSTGRFG